MKRSLCAPRRSRSALLVLATLTLSTGCWFEDKPSSPPAATCQPATCSGTGQSCGALDDGCGQTLWCGECKTDSPTPGGPLVFDEVAYPVSGSVTVNGKKPTRAAYACQDEHELVRIWFKEKNRRYEAFESIYCANKSYTWSTKLPAGTYEVHMMPGGHTYLWDMNLPMVDYLANPALVVSGPMTGINLDEPSYSVRGAIRVDGEVPVASTGTDCAYSEELAQVRFTDKSRGYDTTLSVWCDASDFSWETRLPPGTYDVRIYRGLDAYDWGLNLLPTTYLAKTGLVIAGNVDGVVLDEVTYEVSGRLTLDGKTPTTNQPCAAGQKLADLLFLEKTKDFSIASSIECGTGDFSWSAKLPAGTYEVRAQRAYYGGYYGVELAPLSAVVEPALVVSGPKSDVVLDQVGYWVSGAVTVNGAVPHRKSAPCVAREAITAITFSDKAKGNTYTHYQTCMDSNTFSVRLPRGTYEVRVARADRADEWESNLLDVPYLALPALVVESDRTAISLDERVVNLSGRITVDGKVPHKSTTAMCNVPYAASYPVARVFFYEVEKHYETSTAIGCDTTDFAWTKQLAPGTYVVRVAPGEQAIPFAVDLLPVAYLASTALVVDTDRDGVIFDETGTQVSGLIRVEGMTPTIDATTCTGRQPVVRVSFVDEAQGYEASQYLFCTTTDFSFTVRLPPGRYDAYVEPGGYAAQFGVNVLGAAYRALHDFVVP